MSNCSRVELGPIFTSQLTKLTTVTFLNIEELKLQGKALDFYRSTNVLILNVNNLHAGTAKDSIGQNIKNLIIMNSTVTRLKPDHINTKFSPDVLVLLNSKIIAGKVLVKSQQGYVFDVSYKMKLLSVENCTINTTVGAYFIKARSTEVRIKNNDLNLPEAFEPCFDIKGDNITFSRNTINAKTDRTVTLNTTQHLLMENNTFENENSDILQLSFPREGLQSIRLLQSNLNRPKESFIQTKVRELEVKDCYFKFDNEKVFVVEAETFLFSNNHLSKLDTDALEITATEVIKVTGNTFEHCQERVFVDIVPEESTTEVYFDNNTFIQFEDGFLKLPAALEENPSHLHITHTSLLKQCTCLLVHDILTSSTDLQHSMLPRTNLARLHTNDSRRHEELEQLVEQETWCIEPVSGQLTNFPAYLALAPHCTPSLRAPNTPNQPLSAKAQKEGEDSDVLDVEMILIVSLTVGTLLVAIIIAICLFSAIRAKSLNREMRERACSK